MDIRDLINKLDSIDNSVFEGEFDQYSGDNAQAAVKSKEEFAAKQKQLYALLQKLRTLVNPVSESHNLIAQPLVESFGYAYLPEAGMDMSKLSAAGRSALSKFNPAVTKALSRLGLVAFVANEGYDLYEKIKALYVSDDPNKGTKISKVVSEAVVEFGAWRIIAALAAWIMTGAWTVTAPAAIAGTIAALASKYYLSHSKDDLLDDIFKLFTDADVSSTEPEKSTTEPGTDSTTIEPGTDATTTEPSTSGQGAKPSATPATSTLAPQKASANPEVKYTVDQIKSLIADLQQSSDPDAPKAVQHAQQTLQMYAPGL